MKGRANKTGLKGEIRLLDKMIKKGLFQDVLRHCDDYIVNQSITEKKNKRLPLYYAYCAKAHILMAEGASQIRAINDLIACQELEPEGGAREGLSTDKIREIFSFIFDYLGKSSVLTAINCIPDKSRVIKVLQQSLNEKKSYFGTEFWQPRGLRECSLERGTLLKISDELDGVHRRSTKQWQALGYQHLLDDHIDKAMQAYTFALHQATDRSDKAVSYLGIGNAFFAKRWRQDADLQYKQAIKHDPALFEPHMQRVFLLADSKKPEHIREAIQLIVKIEDGRLGHGRVIAMGPKEMHIFSNCIKKMFAKHGKKKILEAIKLLDDGNILLNDILDDTNKQHFLGKHFWKNRIPFTSCSRNKGTLKEIDVYLQENPAPRFFDSSWRNSASSIDSHTHVSLRNHPR